MTGHRTDPSALQKKNGDTMQEIKCPNCGVEQKGLDLKETNGSVVCSECEMQFKVKVEEKKEAIQKADAAE